MRYTIFLFFTHIGKCCIKFRIIENWIISKTICSNHFIMNQTFTLSTIYMFFSILLVGSIHVQGNPSRRPEVVAERRALLFIALSGIAGATSWLFYFLALKTGQLSQVAPIDKLSVVFSVLLAIALFGEHVSAVHALAIALIAAGGLMLAIF